MPGPYPPPHHLQPFRQLMGGLGNYNEAGIAVTLPGGVGGSLAAHRTPRRGGSRPIGSVFVGKGEVVHRRSKPSKVASIGKQRRKLTYSAQIHTRVVVSRRLGKGTALPPGHPLRSGGRGSFADVKSGYRTERGLRGGGGGRSQPRDRNGRWI